MSLQACFVVIAGATAVSRIIESLTFRAKVSR